jgi:hypothetical protein
MVSQGMECLMTMREEIELRFQANIQRVRNVVGVYTSGSEKRKGRRAVQESDILRAAVVLLHATLEDLLRSLAEWKLPSAPPEVLSEIPLAGTRGKKSLGIQELAGFRGRSVDEVISLSVSEYLERSSYNHPGDVRAVLSSVGVDELIVGSFAKRLAAMMARRHWIAHRADRNPLRGPGPHKTKSLSIAELTRWVDTVERFGKSVLSRV